MRELKFDLTVDSSALFCPNAKEFYSKVYINAIDPANYYLMPNVKTSAEIGNLGFKNIVKDASCSFTNPTGGVLSATSVSVRNVAVLAEICQYDLESSFVQASMRPGNAWDVASFFDHYWGEIQKETAAEVAQILYKGDTTNTAYSGDSSFLALCDGWEKRLANDASVIDVVASAVTFANVISYMTAVVTAAPAEIMQDTSKLIFEVSPDILTKFRIAAAIGNTQAYITQDNNISFLGIPLVGIAAMSANKMILRRKDSFVYAFDIESDQRALKAVYMMDTVAEPLIRSRADFRIGTQILNPSQIVYWS
jgi:hypothetical protein